jgi:hypothetical protein
VLVLTVFAVPNIHAKSLVGERRPVVVSTRRVSPLLVWLCFSLSKNKKCSSVVSTSLNCNNIVLLFEVSDVSRNGIKVVDFMFGILGLADSHQILTASEMVAPEENSSGVHL